jgi:ribosome recycling factor
MYKELFDQPIAHLKQELSVIHTNRANPSLVQDVLVEAYESQMKLVELANITAPEPQLLLIQPWDGSVTKAIETALQQSDVQVNPVVDSQVIRISFPPLTEERRKELVKVVHQKVEDARIAIRKVREEVLKELKEQEKNGDISEDDYFREEKEVQQSVDAHNNTVKDISEKKESELMTV